MNGLAYTVCSLGLRFVRSEIGLQYRALDALLEFYLHSLRASSPPTGTVCVACVSAIVCGPTYKFRVVRFNDGISFMG